jgi:hypothetical protein
MKNRNKIVFAFSPLALTICLYLVFYSRIESKPNHPGFWFILALGMSLGIVMTRFSQWSKTNRKNNE